MKKGQTEDIFADLIPSIIILIIAVIFLSFLSGKQVDDVENKILEMESKNAHETDFQLLLKTDLEKLLPEEILLEFEKKGDDVGKFTVSDVIRLSNLKEEKYPGLEMQHLNKYVLREEYLKKIPFRGEESDWEFYLIFVSVVHGLKLLDIDEENVVEIIYPNGDIKKIEVREEILDPRAKAAVKKIQEDTIGSKIKVEFFIPGYDGGEIKLKIKGR